MNRQTFGDLIMKISLITKLMAFGVGFSSFLLSFTLRHDLPFTTNDVLIIQLDYLRLIIWMLFAILLGILAFKEEKKTLLERE